MKGKESEMLSFASHHSKEMITPVKVTNNPHAAKPKGQFSTLIFFNLLDEE